MPVADNLRNLRKRRKLTQRELSDLSGVSQQAISFIENGRNTPNEGTLQLLAKALDSSVAELTGEPVSPAARAASAEELHLLALFRCLNPEGRSRLIEQAEDLVAREKYTQEKSHRAI